VTSPDRFAVQSYDVRDHVLAAYAKRVADLDSALSGRLDEGTLTSAAADVPDEWLEPVPGADTPDAVRAAYVRFLTARLAQPESWLPQERAA
jgi:hypothetical protein